MSINQDIILVQTSPVRVKKLDILVLSGFNHKGILASDMFNAYALNVVLVVSR